MGIGYFAVDSKNRIHVLNNEILNYAGKDRKNVFWHGSGRIESNDLVIYMGREFPQGIYTGENDFEADDRRRLYIYRYDNPDSVPYVKELRPGDDEKGIVADIVYSGEKIRIQFPVKGMLSIEVNGRVFSEEKYSGELPVLLLIDYNGVSYFTSPDTSYDEIKNILSGGRFNGYIKKYITVLADEFFDSEILDGLKKTDSTGVKTYFNMDGECFCLEKKEQDILETCMDVYSLGKEEDYVEDIRNDMKVYNRLYANREIRTGINELGCEARLKGTSSEIESINRKLDKVCKKNVTIVLTGESGTGKTYLARQIHKNSKRASGPFISVNCASIAYNLIESELFGYVDGAFTGARKGGKIGYFELANGGTLFLDEISEVPMKLQGKLLEVLQEGTFYAVGGIKKIKADFRLIVATNRNLEKMVKDNKFREDLYYRINVFPIHLPPLRDRVDDLYSIAEDALPLICERLDIDPLMLTAEALDKLKSYEWPGNIRELVNVLEKACVIADENFIRGDDIIFSENSSGVYATRTLREKMSQYEREIIIDAYEKYHGNRKLMAEYLGISKTNLFDKIHQYSIEEDNGDGDFK